jgi:hypothetical protein
MSYESPTASARDHFSDERPETNEETHNRLKAEERDADEQNQHKAQKPLKGTDTPATTNAEDIDKAKRTTL